MIEIAGQQDTKNEVTWICKPVQEYNFVQHTYSLIISFESFHLFPDQSLLIKRFYSALQKGGFLCIGWCQYNWEEMLKSSIIEIFKRFGILWGEWGYQAFPDFPRLLKQSRLSFTPLKTDTVTVITTANVRDIAKYLSCINKALVLKKARRDELCRLLEERFLSLSASEWISGESGYFISYVSKID
jgi:hypothetical protein